MLCSDRPVLGINDGIKQLVGFAHQLLSCLRHTLAQALPALIPVLVFAAFVIVNGGIVLGITTFISSSSKPI